MKRIFKLGIGTAALMATFGVAGSAFAQDMNAEGEVGMSLPGAPPGAPAGEAQGDSDHDAVVGRFGVGYLGAYQVPFPAGPVQAPVVGMRYWIDRMIGLDIGLGFHNDGGSDTVSAGGNSNTTDIASTTAVLLHGGVPLSLTSSKHFSFQIVPEVNVGFSTQNQKDVNAAGDDISNSGFLLDLGARAGAEIQFGFIGIPELALQGGIGLHFVNTKVTQTTTPNNGPETKNESTRTLIETTVNGNPWDIFTSNIAALYYF